VSSSRSTESVTCLGCGCGCDDLTVQVKNDRIVDVSPACPVAQAWFGDGSVSDAITRGGTPASLEQAITEAASTLADSAGRVLVYIGPELSSQTQRTALAIADLLRARVDTATSRPAAAGLLAAQRRGRAGATLAEIRNRADVILFWAVDPRDRYPRFISRFVDATGTHVPLGRKGRRLIAVSVGADRGPPGADLELAIAPSEEIDALSVMRATVLGNTLGSLSATLESAAKAAKTLSEAKYGVLVHEAEAAAESSNPLRAEGLIALTQALNGPTRAALCSLRAGGNRSGAESVLTSQTGYPMAVDFSQGFPRYGPGSRALESPGDVVAVLVAGSVTELTTEAAAAFGKVPTFVIGPRASQAPFPTRIAIDTGVAGIHEAGTGYRLDEIPLPLRPPLTHARSGAETLRALLVALRSRSKKS
jgi:formylmethanofuran dehydrogenase subunit B